jgi:hypothetical protein
MSKHKYKPTIGSSVYLLLEATPEGGKVVYIGESINPLSRIGSHIKSKVFTSYRILKCHPKRRKYWEKVLIARYLPRYNKTNNPRWLRGGKRDNVLSSSDFPIQGSSGIGPIQPLTITGTTTAITYSALCTSTACLNLAENNSIGSITFRNKS